LASISLGFLLQLQVSAVLFNLIPLPPLDGFNAIAPWMPDDARERFQAFSTHTFTLLFLAFWLIPPLSYLFWDIVFFISDWLGVPGDLGYEGYRAFQFWKHSGN
jgi:Zn-dependent protease